MRDVELAVWRAVGESPDLPTLLTRVLPALRPFAIDAIVVWSVQLDRVRSEVLASTVSGLTLGVTRQGTEACLRDVALWCQRGQASPASAASAPATIASRSESDVLVPLCAVDRDPAVPERERPEHGVLTLQGAGGAAALESGLAQLLQAPFTAALGRARQLNRLVLERTAQAADRDALLSRLQRDDITDSIIGSEGGLRQVFQQVEQVAHTDTPVLILGETGSGKEVVARAIHTRSRRAGAPVVRVNCGAIPNELIDSELFGHERGSFTGATGTRQGWFERANGGTLFLDEIGELALPAQVRLLRILQDGVLRRVGAHDDLRVDVRLVAATHRNLSEMVASGAFRQDLWYRINVFPIRLPPLRERPQDIPALAAHFVQRATKRLGGLPCALDGKDLSLLLAYHWPGNVRELATVIERAAILGGGRALDLAAALGSVPVPLAQRTITAGTAAAASSTLDTVLREHVEVALRHSRGRIEGPFGAARALGINPHTLRSRMRKLGIDWREYRDP